MLGDRLERVENARARGGDGFDDRLAFALQFCGEVWDGHDVWQVALVELQDVRNVRQVVALRLQVLFKVVQRLDVRVHALLLRVRDEDDSVHAFQDQLARGVVKNLAGNGVKMKARFEAADGAEFQRHEVEEESPVGLRRQADQFALGLRGGGVEDVLQVRRLAAQPWAVIDDLAVDLARSVVNESHNE